MLEYARGSTVTKAILEMSKQLQGNAAQGTARHRGSHAVESDWRIRKCLQLYEGANKSEARQDAAHFKRGSVPAEAATSQDQVVSRVLDAQEKEWKKRIYEALLEVMDLSLISTISETEARKQIRSISGTLLHEQSAPMSLSQRQQIIRCIEDEVMGLGPLEPLLADKTVSDILVNGPQTGLRGTPGQARATDIRIQR